MRIKPVRNFWLCWESKLCDFFLIWWESNQQIHFDSGENQTIVDFVESCENQSSIETFLILMRIKLSTFFFNLVRIKPLSTYLTLVCIKPMCIFLILMQSKCMPTFCLQYIWNQRLPFFNLVAIKPMSIYCLTTEFSIKQNGKLQKNRTTLRASSQTRLKYF